MLEQLMNNNIFTASELEELLEMANKSKEIGKPEAIDLIYDEILKIYNANNKEKLHKKESKPAT